MAAALPSVTVSVVVYRDYASPLAMARSLAEATDPALPVRLVAVDNSDLAPGDPLAEGRDAFAAALGSLGLPLGAELLDAGGNLGFGAGNNLALARASTDYTAFVNPDVLFEGDALSAMAAFMEARPGCGMCCPAMVDGEGRPLSSVRRDPTALDALNRTLLGGRLRRRAERHEMAGEDRSRPFRVPFAQGSFLLGRTALLRELGGFDERFFMYLEDADLCRRVNEVSELLYCPGATVVHKWERGSHRDLGLLRRHLQSYALYFRKWGLKLA